MAQQNRSDVATPDATAAIAQTREQAGGAAPVARERGMCGLVGRDFEIDENVTRAVQCLPYERKANDPIYRTLRIFSLDPSASKLEGAQATVSVPYEPLQPGPLGSIFEVDDYDETQRTHWGRVDLDDRSLLLSDGRAPSTADPLFHQQMVYAVCVTVYTAFRRALGRHPTWGHSARGVDGKWAGRLRIRPHAFQCQNAFYDRSSGELSFGYFEAPADVGGRTLPGGVVFTCLSHDIVAHEVTHALLDGLRAHLSEPTNADVLGFHEGFADIVATFQHFSYREVVQAAISRSNGRLESGVELLAGIAHEFGRTRGSTQPLRTAFEDLDGRRPKQYRADMEAHEMGEILVQALFASAVTIFKRKTAQYLRLATSGTGRLPPGDLPADLQRILSEQASKVASHFLSICIRALDYCPPVDLELGEYLRALITADYELVPDDRWAYREALLDAFSLRGIYPQNVHSLSEDSLRWTAAELSVATIADLDFATLKFNGDPASPAHPQELHRQATAFGRLLGCPQNIKQFGFAQSGDPALGGDEVERPRIHSIRSARRVGPDGQIVFDLVAEVTQRRLVKNATGVFPFYGGATVIVGPKGEVRYVIAKNVLNRERLEKRRRFLTEGGTRFWQMHDGVMQPLRNPFKLLHTPRDGVAATPAAGPAALRR